MISVVNGFISHSSKVLFWLVSNTSFMFVLLFGGECLGQSQLQAIIELQQFSTENTQWIDIIASRKQDRHFYLSTQQGEIFEVSDVNERQSSLLKISEHYPEITSLEAMALHPNFALSQQQGYLTFYTAHIETHNPKYQNSRLTDKSLSKTFANDLVVVEWQLSAANTSRVDNDRKREIIRIATNKNSDFVNQIGFNPYIKSWSDDFGYLFITLSAESPNTSPLYSGAILRINPKKFGLRAYTTPKANPFIDNEVINDEIVIYGLGEVNSIHWLKRNQKQLLVNHTKEDRLISQANIGDNFIQSLPKVRFGLNKNEQNNKNAVSIYRGSQFKELRNKLLIFIKKSDNWLVKALNTQSLEPSLDISSISQVISKFPDNFLLFTDQQDEVLFLNPNDNLIYQLNQAEAPKHGRLAPNIEHESKNENNDKLIIVITISIVVFTIFILYYTRKGSRFKSVKEALQKNYVKADLDENKQTLMLFHRHENTPSRVIKLSEITSFGLTLNEQVLLAIEKDHIGYSIEKEKQLQNQLNAEKRIKMIDERIRKLELIIETNDGPKAIVELYLRQGNHRFTKLKFTQVINELTNWLWLVAQTIAPLQTEQRPIRKNPEVSMINPSATIVQPKVEALPTTDNVPSPSPSPSPSPKNSEKTHETNVKLTDTRLIDALDKLARLKAEGFLTEEEFNLAKARVLKDLSLQDE